MSNYTKILTKHWGQIDPYKIEDYLNVGGYKSLRKIIREMELEEGLEEIKKSRLSGRGGAGFLTGDKLALVKSQTGVKYFICNLDESEPGTYKDRSIVSNNPHLLIEGIIIASLIIGAKKAFIYINGNYKREKEILKQAIIQAKENEFIGRGIMGSCYDLEEVEIFQGAGAYVCGEETALINSMEGHRGEPKIRPPYPTEVGLYGRPTAVNNAETIANIPWIILNGGEKYSEIGAPASPGTKLYILGGSVRNQGVFEAPTGLTIRQVIDELGGGLKPGKEFWFAQIGGASGRLAVEEDLDKSLTFDRKEDIPLGSGSVLVVDKSVEIYDLLLSWTSFFRRESCGKCVPCREGTFRLHELVKRFEDKVICERDKIAIRDILWTLENTTFCPLGKFAATAFRDVIEKLNLLT